MRIKLPNTTNLQRAVDEVTQLSRKYPDGEVDVSDLSVADIGAITYLMSPQKKAPIYEGIVIKMCGGTKIPSSLNRGDFLYVGAEGREIYVEVKISTTNAKRALNARQIRLYQQVDYYLLAYIDELEPKNTLFYLLTHDEMKRLCDACGSICHGTRGAVANNVNLEYGISLATRNPNLLPFVNHKLTECFVKKGHGYGRVCDLFNANECTRAERQP